MALDFPDDPHPHAVQGLGELPPLDSRRRAENEAWPAFTARVMSDPPQLRALRDEAYDALRAVPHGWVTCLIAPGTRGGRLLAGGPAARLAGRAGGTRRDAPGC